MDLASLGGTLRLSSGIELMKQTRCWVEILANDDAEALWAKLFKLVSRHSSIRNLLNSDRLSRARLNDLNTDFTQDLFLKIHRKNRWKHYVDAGYSDADIEHELYHLEIPNLVSLLLRERYPEGYRMARRISNLIRTRSEFRRYARSKDVRRSSPDSKLTLRVYGLSEWPDDKPFRAYQNIDERIKEVPFRGRDRRRAGRAGSSHIIISNNNLADLLVEIFAAADSPLDVRIIRSLVLSKLPIEDTRFVSIDAAVVPDGVSESEPLKVDLADVRPTPEQLLLENESTEQVEAIAVELLEKMREVVRNKPNRYSKLARVAWHCYFDVSSPSQIAIASKIGISNSLVSQYRKLFDSVIQDVRLGSDQYIPFLHAFGANLEMSIRQPPVRPEKSGHNSNLSAAPRYRVATAG